MSNKICSEAWWGSIGVIIGIIHGNWMVDNQLKRAMGVEAFESLDWVDLYINSSVNSYILNVALLYGAIGVVLASVSKAWLNRVRNRI